MTVMLAGIPIADDDVLELARLVDVPLAERLHAAVDQEVKLLALTIDERLAILATLDDPPDGLAELRGVLAREVEWRRREGL